MDLLSSIRKSGSRGGVNFSWDEVQTSQHRENYLGHSLMAPVGRWQKGKDLSWYAKSDDKEGVNGETAEEKRVRERKEEIRRIKEAEEDALARALGLPVAVRDVTGSNAISVGEVNRVVKEVGVGEEGDVDTAGIGKGFGNFVGKVPGGEMSEFIMAQEGGLRGKSDKIDKKLDDRSRSRSRERRRRRHRHRSRSGEIRRYRSRSGERYNQRRRRDDRDDRRPRSRSMERRERRYRSRSPDRRGRSGQEEHGGKQARRRRSQSPVNDTGRDRASERC